MQSNSATTSATTSSVTATPSTISVPYRWQRCKFGTTVYYVSPSGRVFLDLNELYYYLSSKYTCKCYLEPVLKINFLDAFNFDANVESIISAKPGESYWQTAPSECERWAKNSSRLMLNDQVQQTMAYLVNEVTSLEEAQTVMNRTQQADHLSLYDWMDFFDWEKIWIMRDGRKVISSLEKAHLIHLTKELVMTGQLQYSSKWKTQLLSSKKVQEDDKENEDLYIESLQ